MTAIWARWKLPSMRRRSPYQGGHLGAALWPIAVITYLHAVLMAGEYPVPADFIIVHRAVANFTAGRAVYTDPAFLFPPSGLLLSAPLGWLGQQLARKILLLIGAVAAPIAGALALRLVGRSWTEPVGALLLFGLGVSETVSVTLMLGNINTILAALEVAALLLLLRRRDLAAGLVLGLALAFKPVMGLLILVPLLQRRWRCVGGAVAVPVLLTAVAWPLVPFPTQFLTITVPNLLRTRTGANSSLWSAGVFLEADGRLVLFLRLVAVALAAFVLWRLRHEQDQALTLGVAAGVLLLATFLAASLSESYWSIMLLPLVVTFLRPRSPMHWWPSWVGVYLFASPDRWALRGLPNLAPYSLQLRPTAGWALLLTSVALWAARRGGTGLDAKPVTITALPQRQLELHSMQTPDVPEQIPG